MADDLSHGFAPLLGATPRALVLGSLPSDTSIARAEYYGHPRNAFWPIVSGLLGFDGALPYRDRVQALVECGVAVWDVLAAARRCGSLDAAIEAPTEQANDIAGLVREHPSIRRVLLNGGKAETLYRRHIVRPGRLDVPYQRLPSTSPAYAALNLAAKKSHWREGFVAAGLL